MFRSFKVALLLLFIITLFAPHQGFAQLRKRRYHSKRDSLRATILSRDSVMMSFKKSDTSINNLLKKVEDYTSSYNDIRSNLTAGFDTAEISQQLPQFEKRTITIKKLIDNDQSSTLRYLYTIRDFLTHSDDQLDDWQTQLKDINDKLLQNENDLQELYKDTILKMTPSDAALKSTYIAQRDTLFKKWGALDNCNKKLFLKVGNLQNRVSVVYIAVLDEKDEIDLKIKDFSIRAFSNEYSYIWDMRADTGSSFNNALSKTVTMNTKLFSFFVGRDTFIHLAGILLFVLFISWIYSTRRKISRVRSDPPAILSQAKYIVKYPVVSALIITFAIAPNFYDHPPMVFLEVLFLILVAGVMFLVKKTCSKAFFNFLNILFWITLAYSLSNLFILVSNVDRIIVLVLAAASVILGLRFLRIIKKTPDDFLPYSGIILQVFIGLQALSFLCNVFGRFSLAKIIGVTGVYNLWLALGLYFLVQIIMESLFLQLEANKSKHGISSYIDFKVLQQKFRSILNIVAAILWLIMLSQNLSIEDAVDDYISDFLGQSHSLGTTGTEFNFKSIIIFIAVIWLSSLAAKIVSYLYDIAGQHDIAVLKKKNRTSTLLIRIAVFSVGFMLAVAASGFPLDKITIIISAFGIGIGFGLQNIVNNLVSGIILAFEKPVQIGDIIEIDGRSGTIREIGIRSSKITTGDGAEVIIPNGDMISHHVINWTLSNSNRRVELIIGVAYGSDIERVKTLLRELISNRDDIMTDPAPSVFLHNLNESSVDFRMFFWAADIKTWLELKSRVLADIYSTFAKEGIEIPFPTQDINLHLDDKPITVHSRNLTDVAKDDAGKDDGPIPDSQKNDPADVDDTADANKTSPDQAK